jgi:hypothetical protein
MATKVKQSYSPRANTSVTRKDGRIVKFTVWQTGVTGSTQRVVVP